MSYIAPTLLFLSLASSALAQVDVEVERRSVEGEERQEFFLIRPIDREAPPAGHKLLLVLPGGDGSADFNPFITNVAKHALGGDYLVAQLIALKWTPTQRIVWPTKRSRADGMEFTTEEFLEAVIVGIKRTNKLDPEHIYTLSWSSGGPAAYAASLAVDEIKGSFVAMSVFKPEGMDRLSKAKGHRYYIYHSAEDKVCPIRMARDAQEKLSKGGAEVEFATYDGGHGWHGNIFGAVRSGVDWLGRR